MKECKLFILISLILLLLLNNACGQDIVKKFYFEREKKIVSYNVQSGEWTEMFAIDYSEYVFFDQQIGKTVLIRNDKYYFIEIDKIKKEYRIIKRVPANLEYNQDEYRPFALKKVNSTNEKVAYFTRVEDGYVDLQIDTISGTNLKKFHFDEFFQFYWLNGNMMMIALEVPATVETKTLILDVETGKQKEKKEAILNVINYGNYIFQITNDVDVTELLDKNGTVIFKGDTVGAAYKIGDYILFLRNVESIYQEYKLTIYNIQRKEKIFEKKEVDTTLRFIGFE
ncbi:MAG: hypothetical protein OQK82_02405 [Candidatus Pacearchaeota archaeon]|nr:hypothetical protein [Candidatus Pacearchaeota archaeon]